MGKLYDYMKKNNIGFVHVTEYANLQSIFENGGILSLEEITKQNIDVTYISSTSSRRIDEKKRT